MIGFDYLSQGGERNTDPQLIWAMSVTMSNLFYHFADALSSAPQKRDGVRSLLSSSL